MPKILHKEYHAGDEYVIGGDTSIAAEDVSYDNTTSGMTATDVQDALDEVFQSVSNGKELIADAITDKGVSTSASDSFQTMADNIDSLYGESDAMVLKNVRAPSSYDIGSLDYSHAVREGLHSEYYDNTTKTYHIYEWWYYYNNSSKTESRIAHYTKQAGGNMQGSTEYTYPTTSSSDISLSRHGFYDDNGDIYCYVLQDYSRPQYNQYWRSLDRINLNNGSWTLVNVIPATEKTSDEQWAELNAQIDSYIQQAQAGTTLFIPNKLQYVAASRIGDPAYLSFIN